MSDQDSEEEEAAMFNAALRGDEYAAKLEESCGEDDEDEDAEMLPDAFEKLADLVPLEDATSDAAGPDDEPCTS